jgi:hypothetical protein
MARGWLGEDAMLREGGSELRSGGDMSLEMEMVMSNSKPVVDECSTVEMSRNTDSGLNHYYLTIMWVRRYEYHDHDLDCNERKCCGKNR